MITDRWSLQRWRLVNAAHSESKDVMTKAQSFGSTEDSEDRLRLSTLTRETAVQGSQQLLPAYDLRKDCRWDEGKRSAGF